MENQQMRAGARDRPPEADWETLSTWIHRRGRRLARDWHVDEGLGADAGQEALMALWRALEGGGEVAHPRAWLRRTMWRRLRDLLRPSIAHPVRALPEGSEGVALPSSGEDAAAAREVWVQLSERLTRLPPPYRQVVELRRIHGWSRTEAESWLMEWGGITRGRALQLLVDADAMMRALWWDEGPEMRWPRRYNPKINRWLTIPPPPLPASRG